LNRCAYTDSTNLDGCDHHTMILQTPPTTCTQLVEYEQPTSPACRLGMSVKTSVLTTLTPCNGKADCQHKCCASPTPKSCAELALTVAPVCPAGFVFSMARVDEATKEALSIKWSKTGRLEDKSVKETAVKLLSTCNGVQHCQSVCCVPGGPSSSSSSSRSQSSSSSSGRSESGNQVTCSRFFQDGGCPAGARSKEAVKVKDAQCDPLRTCEQQCCESESQVRVQFVTRCTSCHS